MEFNYYQILGIPATANEQEIKSAYKGLAKKYHPDKHPGSAFHEEHFKKVNSAYQTLSDPDKRRRYDLRLQYQAQKKTNTANPPPTASAAGQKQQRKVPPKAQQPAYDKKKRVKYISVTLVAFAVFITGAIFFYNYMNRITALDRLKDAKSYEKERQYLLAARFYSEAISYDPDLTEAYTHRARLRVHLFKDYNSAAADYLLAIKHSEHPGFDLYFQRAKCLLKNKDYEEGIKDLNTALSLNPAFDSLWFYRAEVNSYLLKNYQASIPDYTKVLRLNSGFKDALFGRAVAEQNLENYTASLNDFDTLIARYPEEGSFYYYRGFSKYNLHDSTSACADWKEAEQRSFYQANEALEKYCDKVISGK